MKVKEAKYLGIYHNPFQYKQKHSLIFQNTKTKSYVIALHIQTDNESIEEIETYFLEKYDVLLSNIYEEQYYEFESDTLGSIEKLLELF